jgi:hypothetical protein
MMPRGYATEGRSISPSYVEDVIRHGTVRQTTVDGATRQIHRSGTVEVVTAARGTIVVTISPFKSR